MAVNNHANHGHESSLTLLEGTPVVDAAGQMRGRVAQFGRGAMEKISQRMFDEFARNLEREMAGGGAEATATDATDDAKIHRPQRAQRGL